MLVPYEILNGQFWWIQSFFEKFPSNILLYFICLNLSSPYPCFWQLLEVWNFKNTLRKKIQKISSIEQHSGSLCQLHVLHDVRKVTFSVMPFKAPVSIFFDSCQHNRPIGLLLASKLGIKVITHIIKFITKIIKLNVNAFKKHLPTFIF